MKIRFNRQEVAEALSAVCAVALARSPKEILKCVSIEVQPDVMLLSASDTELSLRCAITQVEVDKPGQAVVMADTFSKIVRACDDELLSLEIKENQLHVRGAGSHFKIVTQAQEEFPAVPQMEGTPDLTIKHDDLRRLVELTSFACARESTRYAINGVLWEVEGKKLTLAATDGRRLSVATGEITPGKEITGNPPIIPTKALSLFARLPVDQNATVGVKYTGNQLLLDSGRASVSTSLVEGQFPNYRDVIPSDCDQIATLNSADFLSGLRRAALLTNDESKGVRFTFSDGALTLSSRAPEQGEATVSLAAKYTGVPLDIGFNPVFVEDALKVTQTDEISFAVKDANRPGVIRWGDFVYVVMPVNLSSA